MSMRNIVLVVVLGVALLGFFAWRSQMAPAQQPAGSAMPPEATSQEVAPPTSTNSGLAWKVPAHWTSGAERQMRLATYAVPGSGGAGPGECAVFYFGPGGGGGVDANIDRWIGEFENPKSDRSSETVSGMPVTRLEATGTYLAHASMAGGSSENQPNHALLAAIVEGPMGSVFFKFTGPEKTVSAATKDFEAMLKSVRKS